MRFEIEKDSFLSEGTSKQLYESMQRELNYSLTFAESQSIVHLYSLVKRNSPIFEKECPYEKWLKYQMAAKPTYYYLVRKYNHPDLPIYFDLLPDSEGVVYQVYLNEN